MRAVTIGPRHVPFLEEDASIHTAKSKRTDTCHQPLARRWLPLACLKRQIKCTAFDLYGRVQRLKVQVTRNPPVPHLKHSFDQPSDACSDLKMADMGLGRADDTCAAVLSTVGLKGRLQPLDLNRITQCCAGAMRLPAGYVAGIHARTTDNLGD